MNILMRDGVDFNDAQWAAIDNTVVKAAKSVLVGRKFLDVYGPLGSGIQMIELSRDGDVARIPEVHADFTITWREVQEAERLGVPFSLPQAARAAVDCAVQEDSLIFFGDEKKGIAGLLTAKDVHSVKNVKKWSEGESAFEDIAAGMQYMLEHKVYGQKVLVVSPDVYARLQRIQPGTGRLESERISALIDGNIYQSPVLPAQTAVLLATGVQNMDLVIGQDMITGYLGSSELNHDFRVFETVLPRLKNKAAVVVFKG